jgi:hypothetical protein
MFSCPQCKGGHCLWSLLIWRDSALLLELKNQVNIVEPECYCNALQTFPGKQLRMEAKGDKCVVWTGRYDGPHDKVNYGFPAGI